MPIVPMRSIINALFLNTGNKVTELVDTSEFEFLELSGCKISDIKLGK